MKPCGPALKIDALPAWVDMAIAVRMSTTIGTQMEPMVASFISRASIFLPRYSGVRPTIRPPTKTAMMTSISMP